ncbi:MAG: aldolase/citrate lyase family protein [Candidatus Latescibacterota bacterium]
MQAITEFRRRLSEGEVLIGVSVGFTDPLVTEALADSVDFIWLDAEHSPMSPEMMSGHLLAARAKAKPAIVRIPSPDVPYIKGALDSGAEGIVVPQIQTEAEVKQVVENCRYEPVGRRGYGPRVPTNYGRDGGRDYMDRANEAIFVSVQIETRSAYDALDEIVRVPGLDSVVIGPWDLSGALGRLGEVEHPDVVAAIETIIQKAREAGIFVGAGMGPDREYACKMADRGVQWLQVGNDFSHMISHTNQVTAHIRRHLGQVASMTGSGY